MGRQRNQGFTIIELMLVLAISGLMLVGLVATAGASITVQRYKDAVTSAVDYFQGQYSLVTNVRNDRGDTGYCDVSSGLPKTTTSTPRGQSNCVVVGQVIRGEGSAVESHALYATKTVAAPTDTLTDIQDAGIVENTNTDSADTYTLEWGAEFKNQGGATNGFTIAIVRSPVSGLVTTFVAQGSKSVPLTDVLQATNMKSDAKLCVLPGEGIANVATDPLLVSIAKGSSNSSGVKQSNGRGVC